MHEKHANSVRRTTSALCVLLLCVYIAAKIDFFSRFSYLKTGDYFSKHSIYWLLMAGIAFLIWLSARRR